jgi:hypothetical protein
MHAVLTPCLQANDNACSHACWPARCCCACMRRNRLPSSAAAHAARRQQQRRRDEAALHASHRSRAARTALAWRCASSRGLAALGRVGGRCSAASGAARALNERMQQLGRHAGLQQRALGGTRMVRATAGEQALRSSRSRASRAHWHRRIVSDSRAPLDAAEARHLHETGDVAADPAGRSAALDRTARQGGAGSVQAAIAVAQR